MHGGNVSKPLHARPNLEHLKRQAKALLADLQAGKAAAAKLFQQHLPAAKTLTPAKIRAAGFRLADAQSVIARSMGFASWPHLSRHVEALRALEGEWSFVGLEIDGSPVPAAMSSHSRIVMDGDVFRMESPEGNYEGSFEIDVEVVPHTIDIEFVAGPEAGNSAEGIFELNGDQLTICLGLVGATRPKAFVTKPGSGNALERLRRTGNGQRLTVDGKRETVTDGRLTVDGGRSTVDGQRSPVDGNRLTVDGEQFADDVASPLIEKMAGEWVPTLLVREGEPMDDQWLAFGSRVGVGDEVKVVFGGQTMVHAKVRVDENASPVAIDYLGLSGASKGKVSLGILDWLGDDLRVVMAAPGKPRPAEFTAEKGSGRTMSCWRKK